MSFELSNNNQKADPEQSTSKESGQISSASTDHTSTIELDEHLLHGDLVDGREEIAIEEELDTLSHRNPVTETERELRKIQRISHNEELGFQETLGNFAARPVENDGVEIGFLLENSQHPVDDKNTILCDVDDTLIGTQEGKPERFTRFQQYLSSHNIAVNFEQAKSVMDATDRFSRWEDIDGGEVNYHATAHLAALQWVSDELQKTPPEQVAARTGELIAHLQTIKKELNGEYYDEKFPLHFRPDERTLTLRKIPPWSSDMQVIFERFVLDAPQYTPVINALVQLSSEANIVLLTSGRGSNQTWKIAGLFRDHPELASVVNAACISDIMKGEAIMQFIKTLGIDHKQLLVVDDSIRQLDSIQQGKTILEQQTGNTLTTVRVQTAFAKEQGESAYPTLDLRNNDLSGDAIAATLREYIHSSR